MFRAVCLSLCLCVVCVCAIFSLVKTNLLQFADWFQRWQRYTSVWVQTVQSGISITWPDWTWMGERFSGTSYIPYRWTNYAGNMQQRYRYVCIQFRSSPSSIQTLFRCFGHSNMKIRDLSMHKIAWNWTFKLTNDFRKKKNEDVSIVLLTQIWITNAVTHNILFKNWNDKRSMPVALNCETQFFCFNFKGKCN